MISKSANKADFFVVVDSKLIWRKKKCLFAILEIERETISRQVRLQEQKKTKKKEERERNLDDIYLYLSFLFSRGIFQKRKDQTNNEWMRMVWKIEWEVCLNQAAFFFFNDEYACGDDNGDVWAWKETRTRKPCLQRQRLQQPIETTTVSSSWLGYRLLRRRQRQW